IKIFKSLANLDMGKAAALRSKWLGRSHVFLTATQKYGFNVLSHEQARLAVCLHVGIDPPMMSTCAHCNPNLPQFNKLPHILKCTKAGTRAIVGIEVENGVRKGARGAYGAITDTKKPSYKEVGAIRPQNALASGKKNK